MYKQDVAETKTNYAQQSVRKRALAESFFRSGGALEGAVGTNGHGVERMKESRARGSRGGDSEEAFLWVQDYQGPRGAHMRRASKSMKGICVRRAGDAAPTWLRVFYFGLSRVTEGRSGKDGRACVIYAQ